MLAQSAMTVVIVPVQSIRLGCCFGSIRLCCSPKNLVHGVQPLKVPQRRAGLETGQVERVNPASEKPKFGRGTVGCELKRKMDAKA